MNDFVQSNHKTHFLLSKVTIMHEASSFDIYSLEHDTLDMGITNYAAAYVSRQKRFHTSNNKFCSVHFTLMQH